MPVYKKSGFASVAARQGGRGFSPSGFSANSDCAAGLEPVRKPGWQQARGLNSRLQCVVQTIFGRLRETGPAAALAGIAVDSSFSCYRAFVHAFKSIHAR